MWRLLYLTFVIAVVAVSSTVIDARSTTTITGIVTAVTAGVSLARDVGRGRNPRPGGTLPRIRWTGLSVADPA